MSVDRGAEAVINNPKGFARIQWETWSPQGWFDEATFEAVAQTDGLVRHGITFILGQSVPTALVLACEDRGIRNITYRQENMGGAIADGFARVSGRVPVMICQNGPAAALAVAPFAEAMKQGWDQREQSSKERGGRLVYQPPTCVLVNLLTRLLS